MPYCFVDSPEDDAFVTIVDSESNPDLGLLNKDTVVARALLGAAVGQERDVALPMGKRRLRILEIHKASTPSYSAVNGSAVSWPSIPDMRRFRE